MTKSEKADRRQNTRAGALFREFIGCCGIYTHVRVVRRGRREHASGSSGSFRARWRPLRSPCRPSRGALGRRPPCHGRPVFDHLSQRRVRPCRSGVRPRPAARPRMRVITAICAAPRLRPCRPAQQSPLTSSRCGRWQFLDPSIAPGTIRLSARLALPEALRFLPDVAAAAQRGPLVPSSRNWSFPCLKTHGLWPCSLPSWQRLPPPRSPMRLLAIVSSRPRSLSTTPASPTNWLCRPSPCQKPEMILRSNN